ncbi:MAG: hypothetical protein ACE5J4_02660 [Candidatus Aenigmatarchaeota archaeon]
MKVLSINSTRGGKFIGPWVKVPEKIKNYNDIKFVLKQLKPLSKAFKRAKIFNVNDLDIIKVQTFAYFLGVMVGDASKDGIKRKSRITRRIGLTLTKRHASNERFGEFVSFCANCLGLRMNRIKDTPKGKRNTHPFFRWSSQSSSLLEWIFTICLGLATDQLTTYSPIKADWLLNTPKNFRVWFLQGLADSDGYVDFNSFQAGIISQPNTYLIRNIIESLDIRNSTKVLREGNLEAVIISIEDAYKIPLFNPLVNNYRYIQMKKLATAQKLHWHMSEELSNKIKEYLYSGLRGTSLIKKLLETENIRVRAKAIRRLEKSLKSELNG